MQRSEAIPVFTGLLNVDIFVKGGGGGMQAL